MAEGNARIRELEEENKKLRQENKELKDKLDDKNKRLEETTEELEKTEERLNDTLRKLAYYENPNTPPSLQRMKKIRLKPLGGKRGAPKGHRGVTRKHKKPDRIVPVFEDKCPDCGSTNIRAIDAEERIVEEIPEIAEVETIKFVRTEYRCNDCNSEFIAEHEECPREGMFGVNLMVLIVMLKFLPRAVLRKIVEMLYHMHSLKITPASVNAVILRVAKALDKEYEDLIYRIHMSDIVYVDETGISVLGKKWWIWVFRTAQGVLLVIRSSRGGNVLEEILGKSFSGIVVCDGWSAYNSLSYATIQRCWAHLLRHAEQYKDSFMGKELYDKLILMFREMRSFVDTDASHDMRSRRYAEFNSRMHDLVDHYTGHEQLEGPITYVRNGGSNWFTCVLHKGVEPTNNLAEQALRELVVVRKIIGALRSREEGPMIYERIASLIATWKLRNMNIQKELRRVIVENMCVSS